MRSFRYGLVILTMVVVFAVSYMAFPTEAMGGPGGAFTEDKQVNQAINNVLDGRATQEDISVLEGAQKKDPKNADLAAVLAGAYGLVADEKESEELSKKAEAMAKQAIELNPNSIAAQVADAGVKIHSRNPAERGQALQKLQALEGKGRSDKNIKYLRGKGLLLEGKVQEGERLLDEADTPLAREAKKEKEKLRIR